MSDFYVGSRFEECDECDAKAICGHNIHEFMRCWLKWHKRTKHTTKGGTGKSVKASARKG